MNAYLYRLEESDKGPLGALVLDRDDGSGYGPARLAVACTLELHASNISSIPVGTYICKRYHSAKFPDTFEVTGVPGRGSILFHAGNTAEDTHGCILLGRSWGWLYGDKRAVLNSGDTFKEFLALTASVDEFTLTIIDEAKVKEG